MKKRHLLSKLALTVVAILCFIAVSFGATAGVAWCADLAGQGQRILAWGAGVSFVLGGGALLVLFGFLICVSVSDIFDDL